MKNSLLALLLLSLAGNAALLLHVWRQPAAKAVVDHAPAAEPDRATRAVAGSPAEATAPGAVPVRISGPELGTDAGLRTLVDKLRAAGFPPNVVRAVINELLNARFAEKRAGPVLPFWQRPRFSSEQMAAQQVAEQALRKEQRLLFESLLGPDARLSATLDARAREQRFGSLSDEKIDQIDQLNRDYSELRQAAGLQFNMRGTPADQREKEALLNEEKRKDLAAVLTPEELVQYDLRNSPAAQVLINNLGLTTVSEDEFKALYQLQQGFTAALPPPVQETTEEARIKRALQQSQAQEQLNEQVRAVLGDARFYDYLRAADGNFYQVAEFAARYPSVTPATTYELSKLDRSAQATLMQSQSSKLPPPERAAAMQAFATSYVTKLEALLGPEVAAAYQKQGFGRMIYSLATAKNIRPNGP